MRRPFAYALAILAYLAVPSVWAEAPKSVIVGPKSVPSGTPVLAVDASGSTSDKPFQWKLSGPDGAKVMSATLDGQLAKSIALVWNPPDGVYTFTGIAKGTPPGTVEMDVDAAMFVVTVGGTPTPPTPIPPPTPDPAPPAPVPPAPAPVAGPLHVSYVVDLDALTVPQATIKEGAAIRPALPALQSVYHTYAATSPDLTRLRLADVVAKVGTPCLIVQDGTGKLISAEVAPTSEAEVIAKIKSIRGVN